MTPTISLASRSPVQGMWTEGLLAGALSALALAWRGHTDAGSAAAPINAVSHWFWPQQALQRNDVSLKHTATAGALHLGSALMWSALYSWLRGRRLHPTARDAVTDAAAVAALAAVVNLKLVPQRLSPGFEQRLRRPSLGWVYAGFAAGLALGGWLQLRRQ